MSKEAVGEFRLVTLKPDATKLDLTLQATSNLFTPPPYESE